MYVGKVHECWMFARAETMLSGAGGDGRVENPQNVHVACTWKIHQVYILCACILQVALNVGNGWKKLHKTSENLQWSEKVSKFFRKSHSGFQRYIGGLCTKKLNPTLQRGVPKIPYTHFESLGALAEPLYQYNADPVFDIKPENGPTLSSEFPHPKHMVQSVLLPFSPLPLSLVDSSFASCVSPLLCIASNKIHDRRDTMQRNSDGRCRGTQHTHTKKKYTYSLI